MDILNETTEKFEEKLDHADRKALNGFLAQYHRQKAIIDEEEMQGRTDSMLKR